MYLESGHYCIDSSAAATRLHWLRSAADDNIEICAQKLGVSVDIIDKLERGKFDDEQISWSLLVAYACLYGQKPVLEVRCVNGRC